MPNTKISEMPAGSTLQNSDLIPIDRSGVNYSVLATDIKTYVSPIVKLYENTVSGTANNWDVTGISGIYNSLQIIIYGRSDYAGTSDPFVLTFNNDTGANYDTQRQGSNGTTTDAGESIGANDANVCDMSAATSPANTFSHIEILIPMYSQTVGHKTFFASGGFKRNNSSGGTHERTCYGVWRSTSAINRITAAPYSGDLITGSNIVIYGRI